MNKIFSITIAIIAVLFTGCNSKSDATGSVDPNLIPVEVNGMMGYVNQNGTYEIEPQDGFMSRFADGLAIKWVEKDNGGSYGLADRKGNFVIKPDYSDISLPSEGIIWALKGKEDFVALDLKGKELFSAQDADWVFDFSDGLAKFSGANDAGERVYGFFDKKGNIAIPANYHDANSFREGLAVVRDMNHKWHYIDRDGKNPFGSQTYELASDFIDGRASVHMEGNAGTTCIIDKSGKILFSKPGLVEVDGDGYRYRTDMGYGRVNEKGEIVINPQFDFLGNFCNNDLAPFRLGDKWGYVDRNGKITINPQWEGATPLVENKFAFVKLGSKWGMIDKKGSYITNPQWDDVSDNYVWAMNGLPTTSSVRSKNFFGTCAAKIIKNYVEDGIIDGWDLTWTAQAIAEKIGMTRNMFSRYATVHTLKRIETGTDNDQVQGLIWLGGEFFKNQTDKAFAPLDYVEGVKPEYVMIQFWQDDYKSAFNDQLFNRLVKELDFESKGDDEHPYAVGKIGKYPAQLYLYEAPGVNRHGVQIDFGNNFKTPDFVNNMAATNSNVDKSDAAVDETDIGDEYEEDAYYTGTIGDYKIVMELTFAGSGNPMYGRYRYANKTQWINLNGTYIDGVMELDEKVNGNVTGHFSFAMNDDGTLSGVWTNADKSKSLKFRAETD